MSKIKEAAKQYLQEGLSVIPTNENKMPTGSWKAYQTKRMKEEEVDQKFKPTTKGIAIACGLGSGGLEVIDVDCKYDLTGRLWDEFSEAIKAALPGTWEKLLIATTISGGYHIYYRCSSIDGNMKLARRDATEEEKKKGDTVKVLIETRGAGGYVMAYPTEGYSFIQGTSKDIPTIDPKEREVILSIAKSFTEVEEKPTKKTEAEKSKEELREKYGELTSLEDYNQRGDVVGLLCSHGWTEVKETSERVHLLRPGETESKTSANFHKEHRRLFVFSTSTQFQAEKAYGPVDVYMILNGLDEKGAALELGKDGYGTYKPEYKASGGNLITEKIQVNTVNKRTGEIKVITEPGGALRVEDIKALPIGEEVTIQAPEEGADREVVEVLKVCLKEGRRAYVQIGDEEIRDYRYILSFIFNKYEDKQRREGSLSDKDIDSLLDEVVILSTALQPMDKDRLLKDFTEAPFIQELGISEDSISSTVDRLKTTKEKEAQDRELKKLLQRAQDYQAKGEAKEAIELIDKMLPEVKLRSKATEFNKLLMTTTEEQVKEAEVNLPDSLHTGISIDGEELHLPGGAISVFAGPTNHGKTILLINSALNVADRYPDKKFIFFTYEERDTSILQYFLNTYMDIDLNRSSRANRRLLRDYFKTGSTQWIAKEKIAEFEAKKREFFRDYIEPGRILIKYVDYNSSELDLAIRYLHEHEPALGGVFVDYFQLLNLPKEAKRGIHSRQEELKEVCQNLKNTAVETGLPLCLAAQFNREATNLERLHPTNIGEAGDIERIVNTLVGIWNMDKKTVLKDINKAETAEINKKMTARRVSGDGEKNMYLEILKSRDLPTGAYDFLAFNGNTGKVKNREVKKKSILEK